MIDKFNEHVKSGNTKEPYVKMQDLKDVSELPDIILKTLSSSVMVTQANARATSHRELASQLSTLEEGDELSIAGDTNLSEPDEDVFCSYGSVNWDYVDEMEAKVWTMRGPSYLSMLQNKFFEIPVQLMCRGRNGTTTVKYQETPFSKGACRWAFYAQVRNYNNQWCPYVFKRFIGREGVLHSKLRYLRQCTEQVVAQFLSRQFNERKPPGCKSIVFASTFCIELSAASGMPEYFNAEELLPEGLFQKFCNNAGSWDMSLIDRSLLEFAKYTFDATGGYLMVTDLQGVNTADEFYLTDPAIVCKDFDMFSETNLGEHGLRANYETVRSLLSYP